MVVFLVFLSVVVDEGRAHTVATHDGRVFLLYRQYTCSSHLTWDTHRKLQQDERPLLGQCQILGRLEPLARIGNQLLPRGTSS